MSDKERRKKDGEDTNKKNQRMHEDVKERAEHPKEDGGTADKPHSGREERKSD